MPIVIGHAHETRLPALTRVEGYLDRLREVDASPLCSLPLDGDVVGAERCLSAIESLDMLIDFEFGYSGQLWVLAGAGRELLSYVFEWLVETVEQDRWMDEVMKGGVRVVEDESSQSKKQIAHELGMDL